MELSAYLEATNIEPAAFAQAIRVTTASVYRYIGRDRIPRREVMARIAEATNGKVQPNDFFTADAAPSDTPQAAA